MYGRQDIMVEGGLVYGQNETEETKAALEGDKNPGALTPVSEGAPGSGCRATPNDIEPVFVGKCLRSGPTDYRRPNGDNNVAPGMERLSESAGRPAAPNSRSRKIVQ
jgi:hypothetical protein